MEARASGDGKEGEEKATHGMQKGSSLINARKRRNWTNFCLLSARSVQTPGFFFLAAFGVFAPDSLDS